FQAEDGIRDKLVTGVQTCALPISHDPLTHYPVTPEDRFRCDLAFVGNRLPDREKRMEEFFLAAAQIAPEMSFILGGEGWGSKSRSEERRVGKECRSRWGAENEEKK